MTEGAESGAGDQLLNNFEILEPPKRTAKISGEEIELSIIPARVALKFLSFSKKYDPSKLEAMTEGTVDEQMIDDVVEIVAMICQRSNKKITKDWLLDNLDITGLIKFTQFVFEGITKNLPDNAGAGDGKGKN